MIKTQYASKVFFDRLGGWLRSNAYLSNLVRLSLCNCVPFVGKIGHLKVDEPRPSLFSGRLSDHRLAASWWAVKEHSWN